MSATIPTMNHSCSAYCSDLQHCELVYVAPQILEMEPEGRRRMLDDAYAVHYGWRVVNTESAEEALPLDAFPLYSRHVLSGIPSADDRPILVWLR